jgi:hypothetical protein
MDETGDQSLASRVKACQAKPNFIRIAAICTRSLSIGKKNGFNENLFTFPPSAPNPTICAAN